MPPEMPHRQMSAPMQLCMDTALRPRTLGKEDNVFDIGYEKAKADIRDTIEFFIGRKL
jgi:hypothetical protein